MPITKNRKIPRHPLKTDASSKSKAIKKGKTLINQKNVHVNGNSKDRNGSVVLEKSLFEDRDFLTILTEVKNGNFKVRMPIDKVGIQGKIYDTLNDIISLNEEMMLEFMRAGNTIGKQGKLTQRIELPSVKGSWSTGVGSLNALIADLVTPTIEIAHVISSVAKGNLSQEMPLEIGGHALQESSPESPRK